MNSGVFIMCDLWTSKISLTSSIEKTSEQAESEYNLYCKDVKHQSMNGYKSNNWALFAKKNLKGIF